MSEILLLRDADGGRRILGEMGSDVTVKIRVDRIRLWPSVFPRVLSFPFFTRDSLFVQANRERCLRGLRLTLLTTNEETSNTETLIFFFNFINRDHSVKDISSEQ